MYENLVVVDHPLVADYITKIRDKETNTNDFRKYVDKLSLMLAYECGKELLVRKKAIETPLTKCTGKYICQDIILVPVLRAGLGLVNGFTNIFPDAVISHMGIYRNEENLLPVKYYFRFPRENTPKNSIVFILDPMLATGGSAECTISEIKKLGMKKIVLASLVSAPEGVKELRKLHKDVKVYTCALDNKLNEFGYIVPGLGDAGDRLFGT
ncbi:MAG: uracil phosphoribosyltransferase [Ignavibacteriae bacterium]|nr:MAG: uracil phosphoribosyltransferase [Ignavibacteriota bacterium]